MPKFEYYFRFYTVPYGLIQMKTLVNRQYFCCLLVHCERTETVNELLTGTDQISFRETLGSVLLLLTLDVSM